MRMLVEPVPVKSFREWLDERSPDEKREIRSAERRYLRAREGRDDSLLLAYQDSMEGYAETLDNRVQV